MLFRSWTKENKYGGAPVEDITEAVEEWLEENITNPSNPPLDTSLSVSGAAADAKATGEKIGELKENVTFIESSLSREIVATQTLVNNKYIGSTGNYGSSSDFVTYTFPLNGAKKIIVETGNYSTGTRTVYNCAFSSSDSYDTSHVVAVKDSMAPGTQNAVYEYDVPYGAKSAAICGSKSRPDGANAPNAKLVLFVNTGELKENVDDLQVDVSNINKKLKQTQNIVSQFVAGQYIDLSVVIGNVVNPTPVSNSGWRSIIVQCSNKDVFTLKGSGGSAPRLWGFCDNDYKLLSVANPNVGNIEGDALVLTAQSDGYFICNTQTSIENTTLTVNRVINPASVEYVDSLVNDIQPASDYRKPIAWAASDLANYIHVSNGQFDLFTAETTAADVYSLYHTLAQNSNGYVTETELGLSSDGVNKIYAYKFKPVVELSTKLPKIFIISGQHGFEKGPVFGLYYFLRELVNNYKDNPSLMYLHNWCEIIVIPLMNPYGFNNDDYENFNGVNLNRNWPVPGWSSAGNGGSSAGDQPETQLAKTLLDNNLDTFWFTDFHSNGQGAVSSFYSCLWHAFGTIIKQDDYTKIGITAAEKHICDLSGRFYLDYSTDCPTYTQCGHLSYTTNYSNAGLAANYARYKSVQGETMEGFDAWPGGSRYTPSCHKANADIVANWIRAVLSSYERLGGNNGLGEI